MSSDQILDSVLRRSDMEVKSHEVKQILKGELGFSYRRARLVSVQSNSVRCRVMRQQYALKMLELLQDGKRILNVDESWLSEISFQRKVWFPKDRPSTVTRQGVSPRISLIAALDTEGRVWFSLLHANTDQKVMLVFLQHLAVKLDEEQPGWKADTYLLLDGARYHTGEEIRTFLHKLQVQVIWSAPYSYAAAAIENLFGGLKFGELNPMRLPTGKKVSELFYYMHSLVYSSYR